MMRRGGVWRSVLVLSAMLLVGAAPSTDETIVAEVSDALLERQREKSSLQSLRQERVSGLPDIGLDEAKDDAAFAARMLDRLRAVDADRLPDEEAITFLTLQELLRQYSDAPLDFLSTFPIAPINAASQFISMNNALARQALATQSGRDQYLGTLSRYKAYLHQQSARLRFQESKGYRLSRPVIASLRDMLTELKGTLRKDLTPSADRLSSLPPEEASRFLAAVDGRINDDVMPAFAELESVMDADYWRAAGDEPGAAYLPDGKRFYERRARAFLTTDVHPTEIHALGLRRVAELSKQIQKAGRALGFRGSVREIFDQAAKDPRFFVGTAEEVEPLLMAQADVIKPVVGRYFSRLPKASYAFRRLNPIAEKSATYGNYSAPSASEPKGVYYFNASGLESRSFLTARAMVMHEILPGHHLQVALAGENSAIPAVRRGASFGVYVEGWGEYAAHLGYEMGLYKEPHHELGRLANEMFFAVRLVVDTGLGYYGWPIERVREYMRQHLYQREAEIRSEAMRYALRPGQALSYRFGQERIFDLRRLAERELGPRFNIKDFHDVVLDSGPVPLTALDMKVRRYIRRVKGNAG